MSMMKGCYIVRPTNYFDKYSLIYHIPNVCKLNNFQRNTAISLINSGGLFYDRKAGKCFFEIMASYRHCRILFKKVLPFNVHIFSRYLVFLLKKITNKCII